MSYSYQIFWLSCTPIFPLSTQEIWMKCLGIKVDAQTFQTLTYYVFCPFCPLRSLLGRATGSTFWMRDPSLLWGTPTFLLSTSRWACSSLAVPSASPLLTSLKCQWAACALISSMFANLTFPQSTALWDTSLTTSVKGQRAKFRRPGNCQIQ